MNRYFALTIALVKNNVDSILFGKASRTKKAKRVFLYIILTLAFLPTAIGIGAFTVVLYDALSSVNQSGIILGIGFNIASLLIFLFGIFFVINVFYFSKDIDILLPMPIKPWEILGAKFTIALLYEYLTEIILLVPVLIAFGLRSSGGVLYWIFSLIIFATLPIIPLIYASILNIIVMRFTSFAKNKDRAKLIGGVVGMSMALGINLVMQRFTGSMNTPEGLQSMILQGNDSLLLTMTGIFPANKFAALAVINSSNISGITNLLMYIGILIVLLIFFILIGERLYFKGVIGISETTAKRKKVRGKELEKTIISNPVIISYTLKELKILFRTPVYFLNCILMNFLWPAFIVVPIFADKAVVTQIQGLNESLLNETTAGIVLSIAFVSILFVACTNSIAATSISREGENAYFMKYIPMPYEKQIIAKVLSGIIMGIVGMVLFLITATVLVDVPLYLLICIVITGVLGIVFINLVGIMIDLNYPKLVWDNEQKAVKQNVNVIVSIILTVAISIGIVYGTIRLGLAVWLVFVILVICFGALDVLIYYICSTIGVKLFEKIS